MAEVGTKSPEEVLAGKRRQAYWQRRRMVQKVQRAPKLVETERATNAQLWIVLASELMELEDRLEGGSSPRMYSAARRALEAATELRLRGDQLALDF